LSFSNLFNRCVSEHTPAKEQQNNHILLYVADLTGTPNSCSFKSMFDSPSKLPKIIGAICMKSFLSNLTGVPIGWLKNGIFVVTFEGLLL